MNVHLQTAGRVLNDAVKRGEVASAAIEIMRGRARIVFRLKPDAALPPGVMNGEGGVDRAMRVIADQYPTLGSDALGMSPSLYRAACKRYAALKLMRINGRGQKPDWLVKADALAPYQTKAE